MEIKYSGLLREAAESIGFVYNTYSAEEKSIYISKHNFGEIVKWDPIENDEDCNDLIRGLGDVVIHYEFDKIAKKDSVIANLGEIGVLELYDSILSEPLARRRAIVRLAATVHRHKEEEKSRKAYREEWLAEQSREAEKKRIRDERAKARYEQGYLTPEERRIVIDSAVEAKRLNKIKDSLYLLIELKDYTPSLV